MANSWWHIELNGNILPQPFQSFDDAMVECRRLKEKMTAVCVRPVMLSY